MILLSHILVATFSLFYTGYVFFSPSKAKLNASYAMLAYTIATGTYLVVTGPKHDMTSTCVTGLSYVALMFVGIYFAKRKLTSIGD